MAAMLSGSSRCVPKIFCRFGNCKQIFGKTKFRPFASQSKTSLGGLSSLQRLVFPEGRCVSQWYCKQHGNLRQFHASSFLCDAQSIKCPQFADSISEGDIRWEKGPGDSVNVDDIIAEVETDKTSIQIPSPITGVIQELCVEDGDTVTSGMELCKITPGEGGAAPAEKPAPSKEAETPPPKKPEADTPPPKPAADAASGPIPQTPPPSRPAPTAPMSATPTSSVKPAQAAPPPAKAAGDALAAGARTETRVKMSRMRLKIAQNLKEAQNTCAMLTTLNEIDMSNVLDMRTKYKDAFLKKHGLKLGFMSAFVKAAACALSEQPAVNGFIDEKEIVYRDYIDISVAVATPKGLVTPVIRNAETMNFADIERTIFELGEKARTGALAIEDMDGGTFTISNGGIFGSLFGTPIINLPQSAILGMHAIKPRPVAVGNSVEIRPMMFVALTYDHRLIDGREAVTFLKKIKDTVEDPRLILLDM